MTSGTADGSISGGLEMDRTKEVKEKSRPAAAGLRSVRAAPRNLGDLWMGEEEDEEEETRANDLEGRAGMRTETTAQPPHWHRRSASVMMTSCFVISGLDGRSDGRTRC